MCVVDASDDAGFDEGSPDGNDPLQIARTMASRGITLVRHAILFNPLRPADVHIN
jgi:hypothetical protein